MRPRLALPLGLGLSGLSALAYARWECTAYRLRRIEVPVLATGSRPLRLLHISDLHLRPAQTAAIAWVRELARLSPDLVALTGDSLAAVDAVPAVLHALEPLLTFPGAFVPGNNDYYAPTLRNPLRYLREPDRPDPHGPSLPWPELAAGLAAKGWLDLTNRSMTVLADGREVALTGVDDPYLRRDRYPDGAAEPAAALRLGLLHVPEPRLLDRFISDGYDLLLAGHTHGGQVRLPGFGALVTNCGIDRARARGLSPYQAGERTAWLHVSAGLGTSPYAPIRFACPPEATLLTLVSEGIR